VKAVEVVGPGLLVVAPGRRLHARKHHALFGAARFLGRPHVPIAVLRLRIAPRLFEPGVLVRRMVHDQVDEHAYAALLCAMGERKEVDEGGIGGVDAIVVGDIIAIVTMRRSLKRHQPDGGNTEAMEIVEAPLQPAEIADAIAIGIHVGGDRQAIDDRVLVPKVVDHAARASPVTSPTMTPSSDRSAASASKLSTTRKPCRSCARSQHSRFSPTAMARYEPRGSAGRPRRKPVRRAHKVRHEVGSARSTATSNWALSVAIGGRDEVWLKPAEIDRSHSIGVACGSGPRPRPGSCLFSHRSWHKLQSSLAASATKMLSWRLRSRRLAGSAG